MFYLKADLKFFEELRSFKEYSFLKFPVLKVIKQLLVSWVFDINRLTSSSGMVKITFNNFAWPSITIAYTTMIFTSQRS